jgi:glycosyltransferase involved in cell wall biosynthesis
LAEDTSSYEWAWLGLSRVNIKKIQTRSIKVGFTIYRKIDFLEEGLRQADYIDVPEVFSFTSRQCCSVASHQQKVIVTVIETIPRHYTSLVPPYSWNTRIVIKRAHLLVALTNRAKNYLLSVGAPEQKVKLIPQGIDLRRFHPVKERKAEKIRILLVSQLHPRRGVVELLSAFCELFKTHPDIELWIAGDGILRRFLESYATRYPVKLLGHVPYRDLPELYQHSDIFCLPGKDVKAFGIRIFEDGQYTISVLEAMASGLPVVVSNSGAYHELIEPHNALVQRGSVRSLYDALLNLVENENERRKIGLSNRNWMIQRFDAAIQCREYARALLEL